MCIRSCLQLSGVATGLINAQRVLIEWLGRCPELCRQLFRAQRTALVWKKLRWERELSASFVKRTAGVEWAFRWPLKVTCILFQCPEPW